MGMKKNEPFNEVRDITDIKDLINSSVELYGDRVAFFTKNKKSKKFEEITYKQFKADIVALGTALIKIGLKGKNIAVIGENRYEWATGYLAVLNGTGDIVPLDKELPEAELESLLTRANVSAIIYSDRKKEQIENIKKKLDFVKYYISMDGDGEYDYDSLLKLGYDEIKNGNREFIDAKIDNKKASVILFTSGTTSKSKAVLLSHWNLAFDIMAGCKSISVSPEDRFFSVLPLHHTYECTAGFLVPLFRGASIAHCEGLRYIASNMKEAKPTMMLAVPVLFESMYKKIWETIKKNGKEGIVKFMLGVSDFLLFFGIDIRKKAFKQIHDSFGGKLRIGIVGAAAMNKDVIKGYRRLGIHMIQGYGMTECSPLIALNRDNYYNDGAAGRRVPGIDLKIDQPNSEGVGEIMVKGDNVMLGYYNDEEETKKALVDGWLHTGDLGYFDKDGFLFITGRMKSVLITKNGKNIYPEEVESILNQSKLIKESMIYQADNKEGDDTFIAAIIVPDFEAIKEMYGELTEDEMKDKIWEEVKIANTKLVSYKHVKQIKLRKEEFEKTTTMKIKRYLVK